MDPEDVKALLTLGLGDCEVHVDGQGNHYDIVVIGDIFAGQRAVQRQQRVYAVLKEHIASGTLHAVNMKLYTTDEWRTR
ncbi:MAG: BolA family protein [Porticoccaceae bacterium]